MERIPEEYTSKIERAMRLFTVLGAVINEYDASTSMLVMLELAEEGAGSVPPESKQQMEALKRGLKFLTNKCHAEFDRSIPEIRQTILQLRAVLGHFEDMTAEYYKFVQARDILEKSGILAEDPFEQAEDDYNAQIALAERQLRTAAEEIERMVPANFSPQSSQETQLEELDG
jgi:enamine deaminase RidA (YjgF/YER057c/UK114 family)